MPLMLILTHDPLERLDRRIALQARWLAESGWTVHLVLTKLEPSGPVFERGLLCEGVEYGAIRRDRLDPYLDSMWDDMFLDVPAEIGESYPFPYTQSFVRYSWNTAADAVMASDLLALPAAVQVARWSAVPLLYDIHDILAVQERFSPRAKIIMEHYERKGLEFANLVFTVSPGLADYFRNMYGLGRPPTVLYNSGGLTPRSSTSSSFVQQRLGLPETARILIFHGQVTRGPRNLERLVRCFPRAAGPNDHLLLLGYGELNHFRRLAATASEAPGASRVHVREAVPQDELPEWLGCAAAGVIPYEADNPNFRAALPNKLFDYIDMRLPVIANQDLESVTTMVGEFGLGVCGPMDSDDRMISTLSHGLSSARRNRHDRVAILKARTKFGEQAQRSAFLNEIKLLLGDTAPASLRTTNASVRTWPSNPP